MIKLRTKVEYYTGYEITDDIIKKINLIIRKRIQEGLTYMSTNNITTLKDLCRLHGIFPNELNVALGQDWYIIYVKYNSEQIGIIEWVAIGNVENKLIQTMEMFKSMKKILLENRNAEILATMRRSTSYKFYQSFLTRGYFEEISESSDIDEELPSELKIIKSNLQNKYSSLEEYLQNSDKEYLTNTSFEDFINYFVTFKITDKFTRRYTK